MKVEQILQKLNSESEVYIQVGFNRFNIKDIYVSDQDGVLLITEEDANNPVYTNEPPTKSVA